MEEGNNGNMVDMNTSLIRDCSKVYLQGSRVVCQHTCSFWANAVGLVSARSGSRYCRGSSPSDSLSGKARAGARASNGPWIGGYKGTGRSRRGAGRRAGVSRAKQALSICVAALGAELLSSSQELSNSHFD